jgi:outer membrane immunogenic protein
MRILVPGTIASSLAFFVASLIWSGSLQAADLPSSAALTERAARRAPVPIWQGLYVGGNIGYSWGEWKSTGFVPGGSVTPSVNGVLGGLQVGHNWRTSPPWVLGLEADIQITDQRDSINWTTPGFVGAAVIPGGPASNSWSFPWFGTVRGRIGYAPDVWMLYFTGGFAYGETKSSVTAPGFAASESVTRGGWTIGGGLEYAYAPRWSVKLEYLYLDLGSRIFFSTGPAVNTRLNDHVVRVGVNLKL